MMENVSSDSDVSGVAEERTGTIYHFRRGLQNCKQISIFPSVCMKEED